MRLEIVKARAKRKIKELEKARERAAELSGTLANGMLALVGGELTCRATSCR